MNEDLACQSVKAVGLDSLFPVLKNVTKWSLFLQLGWVCLLLYKMTEALQLQI